MAKLPLEGIRVVDLGTVFAAPYATMLLADMGAEVIRVESLQHFPIATRGPMARPSKELIKTLVPWAGGYPNREPGPRAWNRCPFFNFHARNKLGMTVDLTRPEGMEIFKRLVRVSDIVVQNYVPKVMEKMGMAYELLKEVKSDIILVCITAYGLSGPYKDYRNMASEIESYLGHTLLRGYPDVDLTAVTDAYPSDPAAGASAAFAVLAALRHRKRTGRGQLIELSIAENMVCFLGEAFMDYTMNRRVQTSLGNRDSSSAPCGCYRCKGNDRWVNIVVRSDEEWESFCRALDAPPWSKDRRFSDALSRWKNQDELDKYIEDWTVQHDHYKVMHILQKQGVSAGPVMDQRDAYNDPHLKERRVFEQVTHADSGTHLYPGMLFKMSQTPCSIRRPPVRLGEHNEYVYKQVLGVSDQEYVELEKAGHIGMDFSPEIP